MNRMPHVRYAFCSKAPSCKRVRRATWAGLVANLGLSAIKAAAGYWGHSQAVLADALHSLSDGVSDLAVLLSAGAWTEPADAGHPYGHGRIETLVTVLIGALLALAGFGMAWSALGRVVAVRDTPPPSWMAFCAALLSLPVKEALFRWHRSVGRRERSGALVANAWHHRSDALSSLPALMAVATAMLYPGLIVVDALGAAVVGVIILRVSWRILLPALNILIDRAGTREQLAAVDRLARNVKGVRDIHAMRSRQIGRGLSVDLHVLVDGCLPVRCGHDIATQVKERLIEDGPDVVDVVVHLEPYPDS